MKTILNTTIAKGATVTHCDGRQMFADLVTPTWVRVNNWDRTVCEVWQIGEINFGPDHLLCNLYHAIRKEKIKIKPVKTGQTT